MADSLAIVAINFNVPFNVKESYDIQVKHRPSIPDNIKHWQVFEEEK